MKPEPSPEEVEKGLDKLLNRLKKDPLFDEKLEFGNMLRRHIDDFSPEELLRYNELKKIISNARS